MMDKEEAAEAFCRQAQVVEDLKGFENTGKTVAFFYLHTDGSAVVRSSADYIPGMIDIAGGKYVFDGLLDPDSAHSSISISMEEFYNAAVDADYLIYNATIDNPISGVDELLAKARCFRISRRYRKATSGVPENTCTRRRTSSAASSPTSTGC